MNEINNLMGKDSYRSNISNKDSEILSVLEGYFDNHQVLLGLSQDSRTPHAILQKIALNTINQEAQINSLKRIVNDSNRTYPQEFFENVINLIDFSNISFQKIIPELLVIIVKGINTPLFVLENIYEILRNHWPEYFGLRRIDRVIDILETIIKSSNINITEGFLNLLGIEIRNLILLKNQWDKLYSEKHTNEVVYINRQTPRSYYKA